MFQRILFGAKYSGYALKIRLINRRAKSLVAAVCECLKQPAKGHF
jgi:hypothetical protein